MTKLREIMEWLQTVAPLELSEAWDNTGLLMGCPEQTIALVQTCLSLSPDTVAEACAARADLVIVHHPLPFKPLARLTTETLPGKLLWQLANHHIAVYSPHTAWDSAPHGINAQLAKLLDLHDCQPLVPAQLPGLSDCGSGRIGLCKTATGVSDIVQQLTQRLLDCRMRGVAPKRAIMRIAIACGSGGSLLPAAISKQCDLFLTGEASFHTCLDAEAAGVGLLMIGHYASERFAMENMAELLCQRFQNIECWASCKERNPVHGLS